MSSVIQAVRGMRDILPEETPMWRYLENTVATVLLSYGYQEIRLPIVEKTDLFKRSIGEVTDIVEKEMYTFSDRNGDSLTLRPEGTAVCVRAGIENGLLYNQTQKLWYSGPMFRHERPQKGRYRQFHQIGVEVFGIQGPDIDAELILVCQRIWRKLGLESNVKLEINSLGQLESRIKYREKLIEYLNDYELQLDEDSRSRLKTNPMRILDSKNLDTQRIVQNAPVLSDFLCEESQQHYQQFKNYLDICGIEYKENPRLVRGLDYYSNTVFEWVTQDLGSQGTVCAGGRFDSLVSYLGGKHTPAAGFAMGMERLIALLDSANETFETPQVDCYIILAGDRAQMFGLQLAESIHNLLADIKVICNLGSGSFKAQMKKADKSGAAVALILGDDEINARSITIKPLRGQFEQKTISQDEIISELRCVLEAMGSKDSRV